ncbi:MAG: DUF5686 and carboxypeptidase regulatory-like domain-containing protein [Candidatus Kapabacteria bacterium]|nr:DUF5686 and carboxypeptidase regulatory-like domain-containing protein [Candidatus Kapabacteria bacterium]MDW8012249.1 DUF5686 family protein [Bacteroidota bacterium]
MQWLALLLSGATVLVAQTGFVVEGTVVDAQTGGPVAGASVFAVRAQRGTYTSVRGFFRLVLPQEADTLRVRSLGYEERYFPVRAEQGSLRLSLPPVPIEMAAVPVVAELTAEEVVLNAQRRRLQNWRRIRTAEALVYSKLVLGTAQTGGLEASISVSEQGQAMSVGSAGDTAFAILETFARLYYDAERGRRAIILQRRQTRNVPPEANMLVFGSIGSLYQEQVEVITVSIPSPIGPEALERYRFRVRERRPWGGHRLAYVLEVEPRSRLYPAFEGEIVIVDSTFALVQADLRPSGTTALPFLRRLRFVERCEHFPGDLWFPTFAELSGAFAVAPLRGLLEFGGEFVLTSITTEVRLNGPLPDSVFAEGQRIRVAPLADSAQAEFWRRHALVELTPRELAIYRRMDSLAQLRGEVDPRGLALSLANFPLFFRFNRVNGVQLGVQYRWTWGIVEPGAALTYALARSRWEGWGQVKVKLPRLPVWLSAQAFAWTAPIGWDRTYPEVLNSLNAALFHQDYYDWVYREGVEVETGVGLGRWGRLVASWELFRTVGLPARVRRSLFVAKPFRNNPVAEAAQYRVGGVALSWGETVGGPLAGALSKGFELRGNLQGVLGGFRLDTTAASWQRLWALLADVEVELPTISTGGYVPMKLRLRTELGVGEGLPVPYAFRLRSTTALLGRLGHLVTAPLGVYGGRRLIAVAAEHNFTDLWWRALGLPTFRGRGIELIVTAAAARVWQAEGLPYQATGQRWYGELGLGIGRIPVPITDILVLRLDICRGVGELAQRRWGMVLQGSLGL